MNNASFVPARELSRQLALQIEPNLRRVAPGRPFALALIGPGSDVLGLDTARSMDHDWGPRLTVVIDESHLDEMRDVIATNLDSLLPGDIAGFPTRFSRHGDGTLKIDANGDVHRIQVESVTSLLQRHLLIDNIAELDLPTWLATPMQSLLELTAGAVFVDDAGDLTNLRRQLSFYPEIVWRYQLAGLWMRIGQINPFVGRTGEVGDHAGSATIAASIARDLMRVALVQSRSYAPYAKWLGAACTHTEIGRSIVPHLESAQLADTWEAREQGINRAGALLIEQFNQLGLVDEISTEATQFHARPFYVLPAEEIAESLRRSLSDTGLDRLPATLGGIDVITDSTDALGSHEFRRAVREMIRTALSAN